MSVPNLHNTYAFPCVCFETKVHPSRRLHSAITGFTTRFTATRTHNHDHTKIVLSHVREFKVKCDLSAMEEDGSSEKMATILTWFLT